MQRPRSTIWRSRRKTDARAAGSAGFLHGGSSKGIRDSAVFLLVVFAFSAVFPSRTLAYRPFVSTDADVAAKGETEVELGFAGVPRGGGIGEMSVPGLILNLGISRNWEVVGEFEVRVYDGEDGRDVELEDPALFLKGVLREGFLQDEDGRSLAVEFGFLLPSTAAGEGKVGVEGVAILSGGKSGVTYHLNLGGEMDRADFAPGGVWGVILEYPSGGSLRAVGELNGDFKRGGSPGNCRMLGFIWETGGAAFDFGARKCSRGADSEWEYTAGVTFSF